MTTRRDIEAFVKEVQQDFCTALERVDGTARFTVEPWERPGGGGGVARLLRSRGAVEKAAVNTSAVWGETPPRLSETLAAAGRHFYATGVSVIVHPQNPHAPTFHANLRYFETDAGDAWFGGGADLTPVYLYPEDAVTFHRSLAEVCGRHAVADYSAWKRRCDEYFYLPHRGEARGIGGIFFDHLREDLAEVWRFVQDLGRNLAPIYLRVLEPRIAVAYGDDELGWQERRRGRYVEFNLIWDRGTRFGLETGGRTESILASLPPRARWDTDQDFPEGSREGELVDLLRGEPVDWASVSI